MSGYYPAYTAARPAPYVAPLTGTYVYIPQETHGQPVVGSVTVLKETGEIVHVVISISDDEGVYIESNVDLTNHKVRITS